MDRFLTVLKAIAYILIVAMLTLSVFVLSYLILGCFV